MKKRSRGVLTSAACLTLVCVGLAVFHLSCAKHAGREGGHFEAPEAVHVQAPGRWSEEPETWGEGEVPLPPGGFPSLDEEVWVIARMRVPPEVDEAYYPGCGSLVAMYPGRRREVPVPLRHTDVQAHVSGYIAAVGVTQQFYNPFDEKIEAKYVFPLPENAAINEFIMRIGDRRIRGIIRERRQAERIYLEARRQGYVASLMTQERPNIFTQSVANIEPHREIDVDITYFHTLAYADGWYEFVFPMVVGPRFNPPGSRRGVGAVGRGSYGISGQKTEVEYLRPGERSGTDIALAVEIDAGVPIEEIACPSHVITERRDAPDRATVTLSPFDRIPNKDFILRYKVAGREIRSALLTHRDERGGFFTLMLYPPESIPTRWREPMEMVFVLDCSGSMNGQPIEQAKAAVERALTRLEPDDTFQIISFSNSASQLGRGPISATEYNVRRGLSYLSSLRGGGGTMMITGIRAALDFPHDPNRLRFVSFLTDGYIGNEAEILREVHKRLGASRIFSFGIGSSPNRYLLNSMAKVGRGAVAYVGLNDSAAEVMDLFFERVSHPAMTDIAIDWGEMRVSEVYPKRIPDLFVGRPVIVTGRFRGPDGGAVCVTGDVADETHEIALSAEPYEFGSEHAGIPFVWARVKIADLDDQSTYNRDYRLHERMKEVALEYGLMSAYTALIAVDSLTRTAGDYGVTVAVPVSVPEGVRYDTTVED